MKNSQHNSTHHFWGWLPNLQINQQIGLGYAVILGITTIGVATGNIVGNSYTHKARIYEEDSVRETVELYELRKTLIGLQLSISQLESLSRNSEQFQREYANLRTRADRLNNRWSDFKAVHHDKAEEGFEETEAEMEVYEAILEAHDSQITAYINQLLALPASPASIDDATELSLNPIAVQEILSDTPNNAGLALLQKFSSDLGELTDTIALEELEEAQENVIEAANLRNQIIALSIVASVGLSIVLAASISRMI
ncbi:MAG: hypothetical protein HC800_04695, partial [Phormidesmis sp. RL_2_1]|nr:hypothetical protein [Phormidesmis sp. RL_2_1]